MFIDQKKINSVYLHIEPVDFRKGIRCLAAFVNHHFGNSMTGKNLFVFTNRYRDRVRILYWDDTGFALWYKILESDRFKWPKKTTGEITISVRQLKYLLSGVCIDEQMPHEKQDPKQLY